MSVCSAMLNERGFEFCDERRSVVCEENGKKFRLENTRMPEDGENRVLKLKIDAGFFDITAGQQCDYGVVDCRNNELFLIELKGRDLSKGAAQLIATINKLKGFEWFHRCHPVHARLVVSKVNSAELGSSHYKRLKALVEGVYRGTLRQATTQLTETLS